MKNQFEYFFYNFCIIVFVILFFSFLWIIISSWNLNKNSIKTQSNISDLTSVSENKPVQTMSSAIITNVDENSISNINRKTDINIDTTNQSESIINILNSDTVMLSLCNTYLTFPMQLNDLKSPYNLGNQSIDAYIKPQQQIRLLLYRYKNVIGNLSFINTKQNNQKLKNCTIVGINIFNNNHIWNLNIDNVYFNTSINKIERKFGLPALNEYDKNNKNGWYSYFLGNNKKIMLYFVKNRLYGIDIFWDTKTTTKAVVAD